MPQAAETQREKCCRFDGDASGRRIYAYTGNDPLDFTDPLGLDPWCLGICHNWPPPADQNGNTVANTAENDNPDPLDPAGSAGHSSGARPSTQGKHEEGDARRQQDRGGEKGDDRRDYPRRRPDGWKGPWPPKKFPTPLFFATPPSRPSPLGN